MPRLLVAFAWGSRSISKTRRPRAATPAARFTAVVVLPTPPFWFAMAISFMNRKFERGRGLHESLSLNGVVRHAIFPKCLQIHGECSPDRTPVLRRGRL